ncbi:MAG: Rossmann-like domain-containing protein [Candidatus Hermodarchaeota archaeon]
MILEKTVELVKQIYRIHKIVPPIVTKVVIGLGYTGVEVTGYAYEPFLGLASTLPSIINSDTCSKIDFAGNLTDMKLSELLNWSIGNPSIKKIIGIATLNGVSQHILRIMNPYKKLKEKLINYLDINDKTKITFIGLIKPMIRKISKITKNITIIEESPVIFPEFYKFNLFHNINQLNDENLYTDILFCTGTTLINNTLEPILERFKKRARKIILLGPTASMIPDILFDHGLDIVGGMEIFNSEATMKILQEGGGTKFFKKYGIKYNLLTE